MTSQDPRWGTPPGASGPTSSGAQGYGQPQGYDQGYGQSTYPQDQPTGYGTGTDGYTQSSYAEGTPNTDYVPTHGQDAQASTHQGNQYANQYGGGATAQTQASHAQGHGDSNARREASTGDSRSIGEIVKDVSRDFSTLLHQEMDLAKAEMRQSATKAGKGAGMLGGAGVAANLALTFLSLALWWLLAIWIGNHDHPALAWSGLIVAALWGIVAGVLAMTGKSQLQEVDGLSQTADTVSKIPPALKGNEEENR